MKIPHLLLIQKLNIKLKSFQQLFLKKKIKIVRLPERHSYDFFHFYSFGIWNKFQKSVNLVSESDFRILQNAKFRVLGLSPNKRFCKAFCFTKSKLATLNFASKIQSVFLRKNRPPEAGSVSVSSTFLKVAGSRDSVPCCSQGEHFL